MIGQTIAAIMVLSLTSQANGASNPIYHYEPAISKLSGTIETEIHYGPPNYGENLNTDRPEKIYVLSLQSPITVEANKDDVLNARTFENIYKLQIFSGSNEVNLGPLVGRKTRLTGKIFQGVSGHHHTDVLMVAEFAEVIE